MKKALLLFLTAAMFISAHAQSSAVENGAGYSIDSNNIAILPVGPWSQANKRLPAMLNPVELQEIDSMLNKSFDSSFHPAAGKTSKQIRLSRYRRQYVPYLNEKGEKIVWINCFCDVKSFKDWKRNVVYVEDGGTCFFNITINLSTRSAGLLLINGFG